MVGHCSGLKVTPKKLFHGLTPRTCAWNLYLEKRVSADVIRAPEMKSSWISQMGPKPIDTCHTADKRHTEEKHLGEKGVWGQCSHSKPGSFQKVEEARNGISLEPQRKVRPC